jgi:hypothetical protein
MSAITTDAPFSTNKRAVAAPIPLAPPVMIATFPWSLVSKSIGAAENHQAKMIKRKKKAKISPTMTDHIVILLFNHERIAMQAYTTSCIIADYFMNLETVFVA